LCPFASQLDHTIEKCLPQKCRSVSVSRFQQLAPISDRIADAIFGFHAIALLRRLGFSAFIIARVFPVGKRRLKNIGDLKKRRLLVLPSPEIYLHEIITQDQEQRSASQKQTYHSGYNRNDPSKDWPAVTKDQFESAMSSQACTKQGRNSNDRFDFASQPEANQEP
jgi:hypothetical protein